MADTQTGFLETGHEPTTPEGDTYLRRFVLNFADTLAAITRSFGGAVLATDAFAASDVGRPAGYANAVLPLRPLPGDPTATMAEIDAFYAARNGGRPRTVLIFSPWPTPDLAPFGWILVGHPPVHLLPAGQTAPPLPPGSRIERVASLEQLALFDRVTAEAFPIELPPDAPVPALFGPALLDDPAVGMWLAFAGDEPAGTAFARLGNGINHVLEIASLPAHRGKGIGAALTWTASRMDPSLPAMLISSDEGRRVYDRMGYLPLCRWTCWWRLRT